MRNIEWATEAQPWRPVSLLVALAGTEGQFSPMFMSVGPFACVHFGVFLFGFCFWGCLFFFFCNKKDVYIFGNDRNVVQIYFCLCCSTFFFSGMENNIPVDKTL